MRKNQKGFAVIEMLIIAVVLALVGFVAWRAYIVHQNQSKKVEQSSSAAKNVTVKEGAQDITMEPGKTVVILPSGARLLFGNMGSPTSVPDFVFGESYTLGDTPNYVPIKKLVKTYDRGYQYTVNNTGCHTERRVDGDVEITAVTSCSLHLEVQRASAPTPRAVSLTKQLFVTEEGEAETGLQSTDPYLFVNADRIRLTRTTDGQKVYIEPGGEWNVNFVTAFGPGKLKYTAEELSAKQTKSIAVGGARLEVNITNLTCTPPYGPATDCRGILGPSGALYNQINFAVHYVPLNNGQESKIVDYQE